MSLDFQRSITAEEGSLSPSDFCLHNALLVGGVRLCFTDLDYSGRSDPLKTSCDFALHRHPAMGVDNRLSNRFARGMLSCFPRAEESAQRAQALLRLSP